MKFGKYIIWYLENCWRTDNWSLMSVFFREVSLFDHMQFIYVNVQHNLFTLFMGAFHLTGKTGIASVDVNGKHIAGLRLWWRK